MDATSQLTTLLTPCANACNATRRLGRSVDGGYLACIDAVGPPMRVNCRKRGGRRDCWPAAHNTSALVALLQHLDTYFVLYAAAGNNWWGMEQVGGRYVPQFVELSYVSRDTVPRRDGAFTCTPMHWRQINRGNRPNNMRLPQVPYLMPVL